MFYLSEFVTSRAQVGKDRFPITDVFLSIQDRRIAYILVDTGSWLEANTVLIKTDHISGFSVDDKSVDLSLSPHQLETAPVLDEDPSLPLAHLPPLFVGPFGHTVSPLMVASALAPEATPSEDHRARSIENRFDRFHSFQGMDVFGKDGQLGQIGDVLISPVGFRIMALMVETGTFLTGHRALVPIEKLRHMADQDTHLVCDITTTELADAPEVALAGQPDHAAFQQLQTYYQS